MADSLSVPTTATIRYCPDFTAFSPTDTAVLSRWAKLGTMLQSLISLTIIALLAARAVNIL
jgi:hypothetical protein